MTSVKREMATGSSKPQATPRACRWRVKIGHKVRCCHSWCGTGACVGLTDIALVYPLAVLATRRENGGRLPTPCFRGNLLTRALPVLMHCTAGDTGMTLRSSLGARRYWAGGYTAGTLLVPYSMAVESLSNEMRRRAVSQGGFAEDDIRGHLTAAAGTSIVVTFLGLQVFTATCASTTSALPRTAMSLATEPFTRSPSRRR
jgi:hypothetical protein